MRLLNILAISLIVAATAATAQPPAHDWTRIISGAADDFPGAIATDASGNVFVAGTFNDTINLGGADLVASSLDMFLAKFDSSGAHVWSQNFDAGVVYSIAVENSGGIVVTGDFSGTVDFGGGPLVSAGLWDVFLARFDADGVHQWSQRFGSTGADRGQAVAVDNGQIVVTGYFGGAVDFGGGALVSTGKNDIFLAMYDQSGAHFWSQRFGGAEDDAGTSVAIDLNGSVVLGGYFQEMVFFGGPTLTSAGGFDVFLAKFQPSGMHQWSQSYGSTTTDVLRGLAIDTSNNILLVGDYSTTIDLGGGGLVSAGSKDIFVARYSTQAAHLWSQRFGGIAQDECRGVALGENDDIVITGESYGPLDFGGGSLPAPDSTSNAYVAKFDINGSHIWSEGFADGVQSVGRGVAADGNDVLLMGAFKSSLDIRGEAFVGDADSTYWDIFVARFRGEGLLPYISSITDVPNDQGRAVEIEFLRSTNDAEGSGTPILAYEVYRRDGIYGTAAWAAPGNTVAAEGWTYVGSSPAHGDFTYSMIATTVADSTLSMGGYNSTFFVRAATGTPTVYFDSAPDSGYSLDNLAPEAPLGLAINAGALSWAQSEATDFDYFAVYGANVDDFGAAAVIDYTTAPTLDVSGSPYAYYYVTATDVSGNEGDAASLGTATGVGKRPGRYVLSVSNYPNPFNPATTVRYTVPTAGPVSIAVFDARGVRVATLVDGKTHAPGAYRLEWGGFSEAGTRVSSGVYFARIEHGGAVRSRKMILLK
jgi:hypothetical protein